MSSSARQRKRAAAHRLRTARSTGRSALDEWDAAADDDAVYDVVDEDEYRQLVESRRDREDFVVDDEGLGYHDDGEEHYGAEGEDEQRSSGNKKSATASLTQQALRKARKAKQTTAALTSTTDASGMRNTSMWDFVNQAPSAGAATSTARPVPKRKTMAPNVDDLLAELDQEATSSRTSRKRKTRRTITTVRRRPVQAVPRRHQPDEGTHQHQEHDDDDDQPMVYDDDDDEDDQPMVQDVEQDDVEDDAKAKSDHSEGYPKQVRFSDTEDTTTPENNNDETKQDTKQENETEEPPRRRRKTSLLGNVSAPA